MRRVAELSSADPIQEVQGIHKRPPTCLETDAGSHNGCGPGGIGKAQSAKASSMDVCFCLSHRHAAPFKVHRPPSPTFFVKHHCASRKDKLLSYATVASMLLLCNDRTVNVFGR